MEDCNFCFNCPTKLSRISWVIFLTLFLLASFICIIFFGISNEKLNINNEITISIISIYGVSFLSLSIVIYERWIKKFFYKNIDKNLENIIIV